MILPDSSKQWTHWLTRSFSLFASSLYCRWYSSRDATELFGCTIASNLLIQEHANLTRIYRDKQELGTFHGALERIALGEPRRAQQILEEGVAVYDRVRSIVESKKDRVGDFEGALKLYFSYNARAIIFAFFVHKFFESNNDVSSEQRALVEMCERLRRKPLYESFTKSILTPLAERHLIERGFPNFDVSFLTVAEILSGTPADAYDSRVADVRGGKRFVYQNISGKETVAFYTPSQIEALIAAIEPEYAEHSSGQLRGTSAYPGIVRGRVRLILDTNPSASFRTGDILVSVNSDPSLMPLIVKAAALVTDEGGMMCHAAIVSRELKIPCVIGTKNATRILKDGDQVEVDAEKGIVRKI
ncbi:hypothetical protein HY627_00200 [Candidatus Uhrbacteria bacterium]|nr:hypothetical protein [Candidatus Uhrbacteria bacterium]